MNENNHHRIYTICFRGNEIQNTISFIFRVHAFAVCDTAEYFHSHINETLTSIGLGDTVRSCDIINIHEGAKGLGYDISKPEELGEKQM